MRDHSYRQEHGVHLLKVKGSFAFRARMHGRILRHQILAGPIPKLGELNEWILRRGEGILELPLVRKSILHLYNEILMPRLENSVLRNAPEQIEAIKAISEETGIDRKVIRNALFQADGIMILSRLAVMKYLMKDMPAGCFPGCSSAVAYGNFTPDGRLLHARNQDYPIVGKWEPYPTVFFHQSPELGEIPYVSVTSSGVHTGGLSSLNREGISLATHAHFGTQIATDGLPIMILGEKIISQAKTINEAIAIAKAHKRNANWAFVIGSAKEKQAVVLEMTPSKVLVRSAHTPGALSHTNYFQSKELHSQEAIISASTLEDLFGRRLRMDQILRDQQGKIDEQVLMGLLSDHHDYYSGEKRIFGNTISVVTTIKSVIFDYTKGKMYVSARHRSPVGLGPYVELNLDQWWDQDWNQIKSPNLIHLESRQIEHFEAALHHYREAYRFFHIESHRDDYKIKAATHLENAYKLFPQDGHLCLQWALWLFKNERFDESQDIFKQALELRLTFHLKAVAKLFLARVLDLKGKREMALNLYHEIFEMVKEPGLKNAIKQGIKKPYRKSMLRDIALDLQFPAPHHY